MRVDSKLIMIACTLACTIAAADPSPRDVAEADALFRRGRAALAAHDYAAACPAFARSHQLDPQFGTLYNLAGCLIARGRLVEALTAYQDLAAHDPRPARRADAARRVRDLEAKLPRIKIVAPGPGWSVTLNGVDATASIGRDRRVDPGNYELAATADHQPPFHTTITVRADGKRAIVEIRGRALPDVVDPFASRPLAADSFPVVAGGPVTDAPARRLLRHDTLAMAGGASLITLGLAFGWSARGKWRDATAVCGGDTACPDAATEAQAEALGDRARARATAATGFVLAGAALAGFGVWLRWRDEHRGHAIQVRPGAAGAPAGVTLGGSF